MNMIWSTKGNFALGRGLPLIPPPPLTDGGGVPPHYDTKLLCKCRSRGVG